MIDNVLFLRRHLTIDHGGCELYAPAYFYLLSERLHIGVAAVAVATTRSIFRNQKQSKISYHRKWALMHLLGGILDKKFF